LNRILYSAAVLFMTAVFVNIGFAGDDFKVMAGDWQRGDGAYLIRISDIGPDGQVRVNYFNPHPIHVARASLSMEKNWIKLFARLQDKGYDGSSYTLYYYAEKDALVGYYYQASMNKTYEVYFLRKAG